MPEALQKIAEWFFDEKMPGFQWVIFALLMLEFALGVEGLRGAGIAIGLAILLSWGGQQVGLFLRLVIRARQHVHDQISRSGAERFLLGCRCRFQRRRHVRERQEVFPARLVAPDQGGND
jgi:hypothetical protein